MERKLLLAFLCLLLLPGIALAQNTTIMGTVSDEDGEPLIGANVVIEELVLGASTDIDGRYSFEVPSSRVGQSVALTAKYIGFTDQSRTITITAGTMTEDFMLSLDLLNLDEVVVTGVAEATPQKKLAFTVSRLSKDAVELAPATSAVGSLQGKVAGVSAVASTGAPGDAISVRLRGSTSITGSSAPLYIVDGVILGSNQVDIDALDIESIEVVKGAAASSLYGSRAQAGVIQITTKRGTDVPLNQTRVTLRNEFGFNQLPKNLTDNRSHDLVVNSQGQFLDADGNVNNCSTCLDNGFGPGVLQDKGPTGVAFYDNPFIAGQTFDAFEKFFNPGNFYTNHISVSQNSATTNFHVSFTNVNETGIIDGLDGYNRKSVRANLDHRVFSDLDLSVSGFYSQSESDAPRSSLNPNANFNPFFGLMFTNPLANLEATDENGELLIQADPLAVEENPLYIVQNLDLNNQRARILGNFRTRYSPAEWIDLEANFAYDRSDRDGLEFYDRGFKTIDESIINSGRIERRDAVDELLNADATMSLRKSFGDLTARGQVKYQIEDDNFISKLIIVNDLVSAGITDFDNGKKLDSKTTTTTKRTVRSEFFYGIVGVDYGDKYIADFLIRRDGSSLFGADERWQTYFRVSGAYRVSEEAWWPAKDQLTEFKLRYSLGTAGGRPNFEAQYETFILDDGTIRKGTLGNSLLKPELSTEQEFGIDIAFWDRVFLEAVYADTKVEDQLLEIPLPGFFGFESQWRNAGTLESNTFELSLNTNLISQRDLGLNMGFTFDRTRQEITEFDANAFLGGPQQAFYIREGEILGAIYGIEWARNVNDLPDAFSGSGGAFDLNDDGYFVAVGNGNTFRSGAGPDGVVSTADDLWGTTVDVDGDGTGDYNWGMPIKVLNEEGQTFQQIGDVIPDFSLGWNTTFRFKNLTAHMLWNAQFGGDVYNFTKQWSYRDGRNQDQDQGDKPEDLKKPAAYYEALYDATDTNAHFIEDGSYVKLREVSLGYTFDRRQLQKVFGNVLNRVNIQIIGRNLLTFSDYSGFDPEVGSTASNEGVGGDASLFRLDNFNPPPYRTFTGKLEIQF